MQRQLWFILMGAWILSTHAVIIEYQIAEPKMLGSLEPRVSLHIPPNVAGIRARDTHCFKDTEWELCGKRILTFLIGDECVWPILLDFDFSETEEEISARRYEMQAEVGRCTSDHGKEKCKLCASPSLTSDIFSANTATAAAPVEDRAYLTLLCRLHDNHALAVWSLSTTRRANLSVWANNHVQTIGPRLRVSHRIHPITTFGAKNSIGKTSASRDRLDCFCGYNVVCKENNGSGRLATIDDIFIHETLPFPRPDQKPFQRIHISETTLLNSAQTTAVVVLLTVTSVLCVIAAVYLYVTQKIIVLRDTGEARALVDRVNT